MKIIHISDTHVGKSTNEARAFQVLDAILADPALTPGHTTIIHTGDLVDDGGRPEQHRAGKKVLSRLRDAGFTVLLCPGNHDYGDSWHTSPVCARNHQTELAEYLYRDAKPRFPVLTRVGDVAFIGLDSNAAELDWWTRFYAQGRLGEAQLQALSRMLDELHAAPTADAVIPAEHACVFRPRRVVLYLHHHPFSSSFSFTPDIGEAMFVYSVATWLTGPFRRLKDSRRFCEIVRERVDVLLFGHLHYGHNCSAESARYGISLALDGGSATCTETTTLGRAQYRVIDLETLHTETRFVHF